jgi:hypothetical protein
MWQQHRYSACSRQASAEILGIQAERSSRDTWHADSMSRLSKIIETQAAIAKLLSSWSRGTQNAGRGWLEHG